MVITSAIRNTVSTAEKKHIDYLYIEWYQTTKRLQRLVTIEGMDIAIRFLGKGQELKDGDVLYEDDVKVVIVSLLPCEAIVVVLPNLIVLGLVAYEIGNKHIPLYVEHMSLYMPYERAMYDWLSNNGYSPSIEPKKLCFALNANVDFDQHKKFTFTPPKGGLSLKL
uniref:Urease accessory protein UreE n=1 Tax=Myroides marinus TaxID=703342 RepID=A0A0K2G507_9FLAO|nr:urease accessory protein UreE [Myroides marinus]